MVSKTTFNIAMDTKYIIIYANYKFLCLTLGSISLICDNCFLKLETEVTKAIVRGNREFLLVCVTCTALSSVLELLFFLLSCRSRPDEATINSWR